EAWSPLMRGEVVNIPVIKNLATKYNKTPAQIVLRWDIQKQVVTIPKSVNPERIISNAAIFDFEIEESDMVKIDNLNRNHAIVNYRDNTIHLLQMIHKHTFNKKFLYAVSGSVFRKIKKNVQISTVRSLSSPGKNQKILPD